MTVRATSCSRRSTAPGLANQPTSRRAGRRPAAAGAYVSAVEPMRAAGQQADAGGARPCLPFLVREIHALGDLRVIVALGAFAWDGALRALACARPPGAPSRGSVTAPKSAVGHTALWLLPPEPAEHVHRQAHGGDARRRHAPGGLARGPSRPPPVVSSACRRRIGCRSYPWRWVVMARLCGGAGPPRRTSVRSRAPRCAASSRPSAPTAAR